MFIKLTDRKQKSVAVNWTHIREIFLDEIDPDNPITAVKYNNVEHIKDIVSFFLETTDEILELIRIDELPGSSGETQ